MINDNKIKAQKITDAYKNALHMALAKNDKNATDYDHYQALALAIRNHLVERWLRTQDKYKERNVKRVYYLSMEFLMGRALQNAVLNLDLEDSARAAMTSLGQILEDLYEQEFDPGLGNGGLGRLAACFLDSLATLDMPAYGCGIRYEFGIFQQVIEDGYQKELPDHWLYLGNPWEINRPEMRVPVHFYGKVEKYTDSTGEKRSRWIDTEEILGIPYLTPIPGYDTDTVNSLLLWSAKASDEFNFSYFDSGNYTKAVEDKNESENITKVLYPNDNTQQGKELRLRQEYFLVATSLYYIMKNFKTGNDDIFTLPDKVAIHLNDTHPTLAIPELMRILIDIEGLKWEEAWNLTVRTFAYTNHTILPEALEKWPLELLSRILPRHLEIVYEINSRFLQQVLSKFPNDLDRMRQMSIIEETNGRMIRMANLAFIGSQSVNGVSALHTDILKKELFNDFLKVFPNRVNNKTNGITPRRWLNQANSALATLISESIGDAWKKDLSEIKKIDVYKDDPEFQIKWKDVKRRNKLSFCEYLFETKGVKINPESMFDVQIKRLHEYKRQLLNVLRIIAEYLLLKENHNAIQVPRTVMIGGKAAPGYQLAKLIIKLANSVGQIVNNDPATKGILNFHFIENYNVSLAERIIPASELSEQISTAGMEASGTGNMKLALNGALTIGTLDGANIEIMEEVGEDNIFIFGLTADEVATTKQNGYDPKTVVKNNPLLNQVVELIRGDFFCHNQPGLFNQIYETLINNGDHFMVLADFDAYMNAQRRVDEVYLDQTRWTQKSIINTANMAKFSSDRTISEYAKEIWKIKSQK
ncbi:glycogen/starch/alpha-glucan phosphorylase [bacterium]|nr:glycogen/starch/alpha-glucan phosphorylase [bacterium]MBU1873666.1 glycogen/starch/alpha-glucan phosphorylase [bacterium]